MINKIKYIPFLMNIMFPYLTILIILHWSKNEKKHDAANYDFFNKWKNIPPNKTEVDRHNIIDYCPTSIKEGLNQLGFFNIMEYTAYRIENEITLLPSLLNILQCFIFIVGIIRDMMIKIKWNILIWGLVIIEKKLVCIWIIWISNTKI